jgi:two-component system OmpR family response regulator
MSRDELLERAWGPEAEPTGNVVDLYIHYLRRKLDVATGDGTGLIRTVRGAGYVLRG